MCDIRFNTRVTGARYDAKANRWHVTTEVGERLTAKFLITAVGCLSTANVPKIPGLDSFKGRWFHTGQWPHEGVDFTRKRVGMIGTGSTGIQAAPVIAETARHLTVFQRTANYSVPARNGPLTPAFRRYVKPQLLLIDEWAYEGVDLGATKDLFRLVSARHRQGSIVLAANTGFSRWAKLFPSEAAAVATVDRLVDDATILRFSGTPYRRPRDVHGAPLDGE